MQVLSPLNVCLVCLWSLVLFVLFISCARSLMEPYLVLLVLLFLAAFGAFILRSLRGHNVFEELKSNPQATLTCRTGLPILGAKTHIKHWKLLDNGKVMDTTNGKVFDLADCRVVKPKK